MIKQSKKLILACLFLLTSQNSLADYFQSGDVKIYYTDTNLQTSIDSESPKDTIVLIHGFSMSSAMWEGIGIAQDLSKNHRLITLDCRGHGKSDKPEHPNSYGPKVGLDLINLLDHLKIEKAHLVGYSMGAFIAGRLAVTHPERLHSVVLGSGYFPSSGESELLFQQHEAEHMEAQGQMALASVARGWKDDAVLDEQVANISIPIQAIFGSEEIDEFFSEQKQRLLLPKLAKPIVIIQGADHDSEKAAVLHPKFLQTVKVFVTSVKNP